MTILVAAIIICLAKPRRRAIDNRAFMMSNRADIPTSMGLSEIKFKLYPPKLPQNSS